MNLWTYGCFLSIDRSRMGPPAIARVMVPCLFSVCVLFSTSNLMADGCEVAVLANEYPGIGSPGDMELLQDGRLLMTFEKDRGIYGRFSKDLGKTWGPEFTLVSKPRPAANHCYVHSNLIHAANGDLLFCYQYYVYGTRPVYKVNYYRRSVDDGRTWGDQLSVGNDGLFNDKMMRLSSGRLIAPVEREAEVGESDHRGYVSYVYYSDDNGYSWRRSENEVNALPTEAQEPHVVELKDGRLLMLCRTYDGFVVRSYSKDDGVTWTAGEPMRELVISQYSSALSVTRIPSTGDLLLLRTTGGVPPNRTPFVSAISKDEGMTWNHERIIADNPEENYGYPSAIFANDMVLVAFNSKQGTHLARIRVDWLYAGQ